MTAAAILPSAFSPEQLERRRQTLGASEIPVVAGYIPQKSVLQLWAEKRGLAPTFEGNEFTHWGNILEPVIISEYARVMGVAKIEKPDTIISPTEPWRSCSPDSVVNDGERGLEVKCRGEYRADEWGEPGTDQVPHDVAIQCHWSMAITGIDRWDVATLIGGNKFRIYHLFADQVVADRLRDIGWAFWQYVLSGEQPPVDGTEATNAYLRTLHTAESEQVRHATPEEEEWFTQLRGVRIEKKELEEKEALLKNRLLNAMVAGNLTEIKGVKGRITYKAPNGKTVRWQAVAEAVNAPAAVIEQYSSPMVAQLRPYFPKER